MSHDKVKALIHKLGLKYHIGDSLATKIINSQYRFTREKIANLQLDGIETEEQFDKLKTNFMFKYIGKIYANYARLKQHNEHREFIKKRHNLNKQVDE